MKPSLNVQVLFHSMKLHKRTMNPKMKVKIYALLEIDAAHLVAPYDMSVYEKTPDKLKNRCMAMINTLDLEPIIEAKMKA